MRYSLEVYSPTRLSAANVRHTYNSDIVVSACVDLYLAVYPTVVLSSLQMTLKKKIALCAALGFGAM